MEVEVKYSEMEDRQAKIAENEAMGLRMLHDDFDDPDWKHGDPIVGTLTFTDEPAPSVISEPGRDIAKELDDLKAQVKDHDVRLGKDIAGHRR